MRRVGFAVGGLFVAFGLYRLVDAGSWTSWRATAVWFVGGVLLHDGLAVPVTLLVGAVLARGLPGTYRSLVQGALVASAMLTLALLPLLSGQGRTASNPSQQPLPYGRNLALVLAAVWLVAGVMAVLRALVRRRDVRSARGTAPGAAQPQPGS